MKSIAVARHRMTMYVSIGRFGWRSCVTLFCLDQRGEADHRSACECLIADPDVRKRPPSDRLYGLPAVVKFPFRALGNRNQAHRIRAVRPPVLGIQRGHAVSNHSPSVEGGDVKFQYIRVPVVPPDVLYRFAPSLVQNCLIREIVVGWSDQFVVEIF